MNVYMNSLKFIDGYADLIFIIAIIEAFLIAFLAAIIFFGKRDEEKDRKNLVNYSYFAGSNTSFYWKDAYEKVSKELDDLKRELRREREYKTNNQESRSNQQHNNTPNSKEYTSQYYNSHADYIAKEKEKGIYVQEIKNDDGTVKSEIDFDLTYDEPAPTPRKYEYLETANGGLFRKLLPSDEKCFFRTWVENGVRKFEFHGNVDKALANFNAVFDDVCEIEGKQNGATQINNINPGTLTSQLKVDTPAKIKLI